MAENLSIQEKLDIVIRAYDIRGIVPSQLDEELVELLGSAFAKYLQQNNVASKILCGRDMRLSSPQLSQAFLKGVLAEGMGAIDLGMISSDLLYFASGKMDLPGAIFTASHNPAEYNGIKFCGKAAAPIGEETGLLEIKELATKTSTSSQVKVLEPESMDLMEEFAKHLKAQVDFVKLSSLKIVIDAANGMGGVIANEVFKDSGIEMDLMYGEPDGSFPNHPADPLNLENLKDLQKRVKANKADLGLAFDGDADRVFVVDDKGEALSGSTTTALIASHLLNDSAGETVAYNLICSRAVPEAIKKFGGVGLKTRVGHSYIKQVMSESGAIFAGEHSGHFYFRDNFCADSGMLAALKIMELVVLKAQPLSQLKLPFESYVNLGEFSFEVPNPSEIIELISKQYSQYPQEKFDGLSVDAGAWWFNLRPSNTEPVVRLNLETSSKKEFKSHLKELKKTIQDFCSNI